MGRSRPRLERALRSAGSGTRRLGVGRSEKCRRDGDRSPMYDSSGLGCVSKGHSGEEPISGFGRSTRRVRASSRTVNMSAVEILDAETPRALRSPEKAAANRSATLGGASRRSCGPGTDWTEEDTSTCVRHRLREPAIARRRTPNVSRDGGRDELGGARPLRSRMKGYCEISRGRPENEDSAGPLHRAEICSWC